MPRRRRSGGDDNADEFVNMDQMDDGNPFGNGVSFGAQEDNGGEDDLVARVRSIAANNTRSAREAAGGSMPKFDDDNWVNVPLDYGIFKYCGKEHLRSVYGVGDEEEKEEYCAACNTNAPYENLPQVEKKVYYMMEKMLIDGLRSGRLEVAFGEVYDFWNSTIRSVYNKPLGKRKTDKKCNPLPKWSLKSIKIHVMEHVNDPLVNILRNAMKISDAADLLMHTCVLSEDTSAPENESAEDGIGSEESRSNSSGEDQAQQQQQRQQGENGDMPSSSRNSNKKPQKMRRKIRKEGIAAMKTAGEFYVKSSNMIMNAFKTFAPKTRGFNSSSASLISDPGAVITSSMLGDKTYSKKRTF